MEFQHINVKLGLENPEHLNLERVIPVFHSWIHDRIFEEQLVDVADYRHVFGGPGVILIGLEADYSIDNTENRPGVRYNRKTPFDGSNADRLEQAALAALNVCQRLELEENLDGAVRFNGQDVEISINDRLLAPNEESTRKAFDADLKSFAGRLFGDREYAISYNTDRRRLLTARLRSSTPVTVEDLLANLSYVRNGRR